MDEFFRAMAPHLAANLLTVGLVCGFWRRSFQERNNLKEDDAWATLGPIILCCGFLLYGGFLYL